MKNVRISRLLTAGVSLLACAVSVQAHAADEAADAAAEAPADSSAESGTGEIVVLGFGQTRQTQTVSADDIALLTPGTSPLKAISKLPGVNFQSADAFGSYEWSTRISLRGFNQNQLGFTLDGVPLGDMSYGNYNGLHISRAIISEDLGDVTVSQGAGALGTASTSNLGGTLLFTSKDPGHEMNVVASGTYGSEDTVRAFVRGETGDMGPFRAYVAYAHMDTGKWRGDGAQKQDQVNAKLVGDLNFGRLTAWVNYSDRRENDYQDMSQEMIDRLGYDWDNYAPNWQAAYAAGAVYQNLVAASKGNALPYPTYGKSYTAPVETADDAYYNAAGLRRDWLGSVKFETPLDRPLRFSLQTYYHDNHGQGLWWTPYVASPTGAPLSVRTTEYDINRMGAIATMNWDVSFNKLELGAWYESNDFRQARRYYALENTLAGSSRNSLEFQSNPFATQWDYKFQTNTFVYHFSDTIDIGDALTISGGWKGIDVVNKANPIVQSTYPAGRIKANDMFLPQIGAVYRVTGNAELFASYTENMRAFVSAVTSGPFSTTQLGFDSIQGDLKPETSQTFEGGARFRSGPFQGSLAGYYVNFDNRLLAITSGPGIQGNPSVLANVGSVHTYGFEAAATVRLPAGFSATGSYAYNISEYQNDVVDGLGNTVDTDGKTVPDSPRHIASAELAYTGEILFGRVGGNYMSKRYYSYENDVSVGGRFLLDASLGAKVPEGHGYLSGVAIEVSVTNLTDKKYVSTVGSNGFTNTGDSQTLLTGAPRQWFVTLRRGF